MMKKEALIERMKYALSQFFIIVTFVNIAAFVLGTIFRPQERFGYEAFLSPLIYGAISMIPVFFSYSEKELTMKQAIIRHVVLLGVLEVILITTAMSGSGVIQSEPLLVAGFGLSVMCIYILVLAVSYVLDIGQAKEMNLGLQAFQKKSGGNQ